MKTKKFEYLTRSFSNYTLSIIDSLNNLGQKGWELVSIIYNKDFTTFYFKREIE